MKEILQSHKPKWFQRQLSAWWKNYFSIWQILLRWTSKTKRIIDFIWKSLLKLLKKLNSNLEVNRSLIFFHYCPNSSHLACKILPLWVKNAMQLLDWQKVYYQKFVPIKFKITLSLQGYAGILMIMAILK